MRMGVRVWMGVGRCAGGCVVMIIAAGAVPAGVAAVIRVPGRRLSGLPAAVIVYIEAASLEHDGGHGDALLRRVAALRARRLPGVVIPLPHSKAMRA